MLTEFNGTDYLAKGLDILTAFLPAASSAYTSYTDAGAAQTAAEAARRLAIQQGAVAAQQQGTQAAILGAKQAHEKWLLNRQTIERERTIKIAAISLGGVAAVAVIAYLIFRK